jgi:hypothetical protein
MRKPIVDVEEYGKDESGYGYIHEQEIVHQEEINNTL